MITFNAKMDINGGGTIDVEVHLSLSHIVSVIKYSSPYFIAVYDTNGRMYRVSGEEGNRVLKLIEQSIVNKRY